jgi:TatD DNase family protein
VVCRTHCEGVPIRYTSGVQFYDAHNHLQDERLAAHWPEIESRLWSPDPGNGDAACPPVAGMVVNGSRELDWPRVLELSNHHANIIPSFGYHPWYVRERTPLWRETLEDFLLRVPSGVGEIGLDRWMRDPDVEAQEEVFLFQLELAVRLERPVTIHCLQAWGRLVELLKAHRRPECGFLLHSYGGPVELVRPLAALGAYFSFPGYFAHPRKERQRTVFLSVPRDRLLMETDAPDQLPPESWNRFSLAAADGRPLHHPANLPAVYEFAAGFLAVALDTLAREVGQNFFRLFGGVSRGVRPG